MKYLEQKQGQEILKCKHKKHSNFLTIYVKATFYNYVAQSNYNSLMQLHIDLNSLCASCLKHLAVENALKNSPKLQRLIKRKGYTNYLLEFKLKPSFQ